MLGITITTNVNDPNGKTLLPQNMSSTVPLRVAIYDNPGIKHWSLFIKAESESENTIIHLLRARQR